MKIKSLLFPWANWTLLATIFYLAGLCPGLTQTVQAAKPSPEAKKLVETSRFTLDSFTANPNNVEFRNLLKRAKGVLIFPQQLQGAFIIGAKGGNGVLLTRDGETNAWNGPAFYTMGGLTFGIQAGGSASEVILLIMTDRGVASLMASSVKLGANLSVAAGPVGGGVAAETINLSADILSFSRSQGLFGGVSVAGAVVAVRSALNRSYYGKPVMPADILIVKSASNPQAKGLREAIEKAAAGN